MKCGVVGFVTDRGLGICDLARQVEAAGLESLFVVQFTHVPASGIALLNVPGHAADHHFLDPFVALGAAAAVTTRIKLGTGICTALIYDPVILAMQVSTLDQVDEPLMRKCAELGVDRCVVAYHSEGAESLPAFLERYEPLVQRFGD
jgi:hypothetical protein